MLDVKLYEVFEEEETAIKKHLPGNIKVDYTPKTIQESGEKAPPAPLICIRTQSAVPQDWAGGLKAILTRSQGYDHLVKYRQEAKTEIDCGYLGDYCSRAVAEQALLMAMALLRKLKKQTDSFASFARDGLTGRGCAGRKALVAGVGHIGREIVAIARALGMQVKGFDIDPKVDDLEYVSLERGMKWAEIVFCALPLTESTRNLFNYDIFKKTGKTHAFINIARGEISPTEDLKRLFDENILEAVGLDVYPQEPMLAYEMRSDRIIPAGSRQALLQWAKDERVLFTPHNAFNTEDALDRKASLTAVSIGQYLQAGKFPRPVPHI